MEEKTKAEVRQPETAVFADDKIHDGKVTEQDPSSLYDKSPIKK